MTGARKGAIIAAGRDELPKGAATATLVLGGSLALISAAAAVAVEG